jgi:hypothetical protein
MTVPGSYGSVVLDASTIALAVYDFVVDSAACASGFGLAASLT